MQQSLQGVFISLFIFSLIFTLITIDETTAQENLVTSRSVGFEETTVIEFQNSEKSPEIETIRMWLGSEFEFKSFKTEKGWTGQKTPQGVIVFTAKKPLEPGESVKFGIKTDKPKPGINWRAIDTNDEDIQTGKTLVTGSPSKPSENDKDSGKGNGIFSDSSFRLVPEKPNAGSTIRVIGESFGSNQELDFFIGGKKLTSLETNEDGHFIITTQIPEDQPSDRTEFFVKDDKGNEKEISLRIGESDDRMASSELIPLTIENLPSVMHRGDVVIVTGNANPGSSVSATLVDPNNQTLTTLVVPVDDKGMWTSEAIVPLDAPLGTFTAEITDGKETIIKTWEVETSKIIQITPLKIKFDPGEIIKFNGTGLPNKELEIIIENPQGSEIHNEVLNLGSDGEFEIEFPTEVGAIEGTYVLFAFQDDKTEVVLVGLGEIPEVQIAAKMDKLNYQSRDFALVAVDGPPGSTISLLVVDPSDKQKFADTLTIGPDGKENYELELSGYGSGVYTLVLTRGNSQTEEVFTVGLKTGSGSIDIRTTKDTYKPGEGVLILGNSGPNILLTLTLIDPDGEEVKVKETFTNKEGVLSEDSFRIPTNGKSGIWTINARSGTNFDDEKITVTPSVEEGLVVLVESIENTPSGKLVKIIGFGAAVSQTINIDITSPDEELVGELTVFSTGEGDFSLLWIVPSDSIPGKYRISVSDPLNTAETTFDL